MKNPEVFFCF